MSKKSLIALMTAAMLPDFSHSDLGIRYAMPTQGCWTQAHRKSGVAAASAMANTAKNWKNKFPAGRHGTRKAV